MDIKQLLIEANRFSEDIKFVFINEYKKLLDENELSQKQSLLLSILEKKQQLTMNEVAEIINGTPSAASQFIQKLEKKQYVKREVNKDNRREVFVLLDEKGLAFFNEMTAIDEMVLEAAGVNQQFTYHKKSGYTGFIIAMICVCMVETVGVSFLLLKWSPIAHWVHLFLSLSTILFLILDLRAVTKNPITVQDDELIVKIGIRPAIRIKLSIIQEIKSGKINFENERKNKDVLDLSLLGFDEPTFEIVLSEPITNKSKIIQRIFFTVDEERAFYELVNQGRKSE